MKNVRRMSDRGADISAHPSGSISAWVDGELSAEDASRVLEGVAQQAAQARDCAVYWLVGDVLRNEPAVSADFAHRVMTALESEPTVLAPVTRYAERSEPPRWMPMAAAVAGVAVVGWMALSINKPVAVEQNFASAQNVMSPVVAPAVASARGGFNDDRAYVLAHQAYGNGAAMPSVAAYVRMVDDEQVDTGR